MSSPPVILGTACAGVELFVTKDIGVPEAGYTFLYMLVYRLYLAVASVLYSTPEINLDPISATSSILGMLTKSSVDQMGHLSILHSLSHNPYRRLCESLL